MAHEMYKTFGISDEMRLEMGNTYKTPEEVDKELKQLKKKIKKNINFVMDKCTPLEMENVEIYFKPKEKYIKAFETLQKLVELMKAIRYKKIHINYLNRGGISLSNEDFFQAINLFTGELDLKRFLYCMDGVINKKHIQKYVSDETLETELLKVLKNFTKWDMDLNNTDNYQTEFLNIVLNNTIDKMNLTDCIIDDQGIAKIVVNIMELGEKSDIKRLGTLLGTLADEIIRIVYVDARHIHNIYTYENGDRKYKLIKFDNTNNSELIIHDIRVPDFKAGNIMFTEEKMTPEEYIKTTTISIPLIDKATKYHVKIKVDLKEECKRPLNTIFELVHILEKAFNEKKLKPVAFSSNRTINEIVFNAMTFNFNITQQTLISSLAMCELFEWNRDYALKEVFESVSNPDIRDITRLSDPGDIEDISEIDNIEYIRDVEDISILSIDIDNIDKIYKNYIHDGQSWVFEADYKAVIYSELEIYFKMIIGNIGDGENNIFEITRL